MHDSYGKSVFIPDYIRVSFTRLRVMSHNLKVETGRWSRRAREDRVCQCDRSKIQDEKHVLLECPLSTHVRQRYRSLPLESVSSLMKSKNVLDLCLFVKETLDIYAKPQLCQRLQVVLQPMVQPMVLQPMVLINSISQRLYPNPQRNIIRQYMYC